MPPQILLRLRRTVPFCSLRLLAVSETAESAVTGQHRRVTYWITEALTARSLFSDPAYETPSGRSFGESHAAGCLSGPVDPCSMPEALAIPEPDYFPKCFLTASAEVPTCCTAFFSSSGVTPSLFDQSRNS